LITMLSSSGAVDRHRWPHAPPPQGSLQVSQGAVIAGLFTSSDDRSDEDYQRQVDA
jgi:hypothetical protein